MPLTQLSIEVPGLGDNNKNLEVEGAIAVGEKVAVSVTGLPSDVSTSEKELRLRVLGPMGEDIATHGGWNYDETKKVYTTTLGLASVQAFRLFFPPPPPARPPVVPPVVPMRPPVPPQGYDPVAAAAAMQPPNAVNVRLVLELRDKSGSDSDSDGELVDASLIGTSSIRLNYWPTDWQTATLIDLANGRVYSKDEVDALIAEEARQRGVADAAEAAARADGDAETLASSKAYTDEKALLLDQKINTKYAKPSGGIPKSDLSASVQASLGKADTALQEHQDISGKADLVGGKVPSSQLPSYVDDVLEYASLSAFPATGEKGKIYVALDTNNTYRWSETGNAYVQIGGGEIPVPVAPSTDPSAAGKPADAKATGDALATKADAVHTHSEIVSSDGSTKVEASNSGVVRIAKSSSQTLLDWPVLRALKGTLLVSGQHTYSWEADETLDFNDGSRVTSEYGEAMFVRGSNRDYFMYANSSYGPMLFIAYNQQTGDIFRIDNYDSAEPVFRFADGQYTRGGDLYLTRRSETVKIVATLDDIPDVSGKVNKSGDEMTGELTIRSGDDASAVLDAYNENGDTGAYLMLTDETTGKYIGIGAESSASIKPINYSDGVNSYDYDFPKQSGTLAVEEQIVKADWDESDSDDDSYIQNKPTSFPPAAHAHASIASGDTTVAAVSGGTATITAPAQTLDDLKAYLGLSDSATFADVQTAMNLGDGATLEDALALVPAMVKTVATVDQIPAPTQQVQADWEESDSDDDAFIRNKPTIPAPVDISGKADAASLAAAYDPEKSPGYAVGDYCTYQGALYRCITATADPSGAWNAANWTAVAVVDEMGADTPLPFDAEVEYVTIPAGAYILPEAYGVSGDLDVSMSVRLPTTGVTTSTPFFCGNWRGSGISTQIKVEGSTAARFMSFNGSETTLTIPSDTLGKFSTISLGGNKFAVESASTAGTVSPAVSKPCDFGIGTCAFTDGTTPTGRVFAFDVASFRFDCATAHRDLVPVRVGTVGYLYDKVSGRLFGSAVGSIPLVPGPDKATPTITKPGRIVELTPAIRYAFASPTPTVSGTGATVECEDRAINDFTVATGITSLTITPPAAVTGRARDFFCRVTLTDSSLPTVTLSGATIDIGSTEVAGMTQGVNLLMFTEISSGHWLASRRSAS